MGRLLSYQALTESQLLPQLHEIRHQQLHSSSRVDIFKSFSANENKATESETKQDGIDAANVSAEGTETTSDNKEQIDRLTAEVTELKSKSDDFLDKYRRSIAENDNMRKRLTKQIEDAKIFGIQGFCKDLLDVADVLTKAVEAGKAIESQPGNKDMIEGLKLTQTQLLQVFGRHGLTQIDPVKGEEKFDPNLHEALFQIPAPNLDPNIVMDVQKIGYSLHGRTRLIHFFEISYCHWSLKTSL